MQKQTNPNSLIGKKAIALVNAGSFKKGDKFTIGYVSVDRSPNYYYSGVNGTGTSFVESQFDLCPNTIEELQERNKEIDKEIAILDEEAENNGAKIEFMKENNIKEFSEDEFKVYKTLEIIESYKTKLEKAKAIANLIKQ